MITIGSKVVDSITGFAGVATARAEYWHAGPLVRVEAPGVFEGKPIEPQWIDEERLTVVADPA